MPLHRLLNLKEHFPRIARTEIKFPSAQMRRTFWQERNFVSQNYAPTRKLGTLLIKLKNTFSGTIPQGADYSINIAGFIDFVNSY